MRTGLKTHYIGTLSKIVIYMEITRAWGVPLSFFSRGWNAQPKFQSVHEIMIQIKAGTALQANITEVYTKRTVREPSHPLALQPVFAYPGHTAHRELKK